MRKRLPILIGLVAMMALTSCDSKLCYCFTSKSTGVVREDVYTKSDTPCRSLNTSTRGCIEEQELGTFDPSGIAYAPSPKAE